MTSARLSIADGPAPGTVVVGVHGALDLAAGANLQGVCDGILEDRDVVAIRVDLHDVHGVGTAGIGGLIAAAAGADRRGAELTLNDPPELLCEALEMEGLTGLIRVGHHPHSLNSEFHQRQARRRHPSGSAGVT